MPLRHVSAPALPCPAWALLALLVPGCAPLPSAEGPARADDAAGPSSATDPSHRVRLPEATSLEALVDRPWWAPRVPAHAPLPGTTGSRAEDCGTCHVEIYEEWRTSTHAAAWTDAQFQRELHKDPQVGWICINCHIPAADQQEEKITWSPRTGLREVQRQANPSFDPRWQQEGITCLSCHWRDGAIAAPHADAQAPHPTVHAPDLAGPELCMSCHQADVRLEDTLVCHFTTGQEWQESGQARTCPECHMPEVERSVAPGAPVRKTRRHTWPGSLIPKTDPPPPGFDEVAASWEPGVDLRVDLPADAPAGQRVEAVVTLANVRAGHRVPTGDPERYLLLRTTVHALDAAGRPAQVVAGARARVGQRWLWWPVARKLSDDRILPGEERSWRVPFVVPEGGARVEVVLEHFRISPENAGYHGLEGYPTHRVVHRREQDLLGTASPAAGVAPAPPAR
ncbi:cytochrome c family protein [Myxococcota bacterium]|nr:cytochrome c family protein [Myxococcota bacterium]